MFRGWTMVRLQYKFMHDHYKFGTVGRTRANALGMLVSEIHEQGAHTAWYIFLLVNLLRFSWSLLTESQTCGRLPSNLRRSNLHWFLHRMSATIQLVLIC